MPETRAGEPCRIYRVISREEKDDLDATGLFRPSANSLESKWFAWSLDEARQWGELMARHGWLPVPDCIVSVEIPDTLLQASDKRDRHKLDGIRAVYIEDLDALNQQGSGREYHDLSPGVEP